MTTVSKKQLEKRDRIKAAAWALFCARGYEETTTKAIAAKAGIASGTLFAVRNACAAQTVPFQVRMSFALNGPPVARRRYALTSVEVIACMRPSLRTH